MKEKRNALLSVFYKSGVVKLATYLIENNWNIYASGGTAKELSRNNIPVIDIATLVGEPILGHKVVTLSRPIMAGLLADINDSGDIEEMDKNNYPIFDLVYVVLYPLKAAIAANDCPASVLEKTDIGGPTMLRAAAKGFRYILMDPSEIDPFIKWLGGGELKSQMVRVDMRARAERYVSQYTGESASYWEKVTTMYKSPI